MDVISCISTVFPRIVSHPLIVSEATIQFTEMLLEGGQWGPEPPPPEFGRSVNLISNQLHLCKNHLRLTSFTFFTIDGVGVALIEDIQNNASFNIPISSTLSSILQFTLIKNIFSYILYH